MSRKLIFLGILSLILAPGAALSLGLGDIRLNSYLNQPLDAEIGLSVSSAEELETLSVALASREVFSRFGLERPRYLDDLEFSVRSTGPGQAVVEVSSSEPMVEPFVTFLVEADWNSGRVLREYTVLLDPPVFLATPEDAPAVEPAAPAVERTQPERAPVARAAPQPEPVASPRPVRGASGGEYGPVQRNETLWGIAQEVRPADDLTTNQVMVALFRANPQAFNGNINRLRAGAVLRVPSREQMAESSARAATAEVRRQTEAWRDAAAAPAPAATADRRLELAPPEEAARPPEPVVDTGPRTDAVAQPAPETGAQEAETSNELLDAVEALRGELAETRRMMELKDAEIAALQARLAQLEAAPEGPADAGQPEVVMTPDSDVTPADPELEPEAVVVTPPPPPAPSLADRLFALLGNFWLWLGLAALLILAAMLIFVRKRGEEERSIEEELAETGTWGSIEPTGDQLGTGRSGGTAEAVTPRRTRPAEEDSIRVEETERPAPPQQGRDEELPPPSPAATALPEASQEDYQYPFEDTIAGETGVNLDQSDPLAEADFHMAYGLYDQAADIIKKAIQREPDRYDLRRKLIDICFVWGNAQEFLAQARSIRESGGEAAEADWPKIAIMGRQICPGEPLFEGAEAAAVDVDFGENVPEMPAGGEDLGASGSWLDFDIGEAEEPGKTSGEPVGEGVEDTREQPAPDLSESTAGEGTAELDLDELGIDLELGESGEYALKDLAERAPEIDETTDQASAGEEESVPEATDENEGQDQGEDEDEGTLMMSAPKFGRGSDEPTQRGEGLELGEDEPTLSGLGGLEEVPADEDTLLEPRKDSAGGDEPTVMGLDSDIEEEGDETQLKRFEMPPEEAPTAEVDVSIEEEDADLDLDDLTQMLEADMDEGRDEATQVATGIGSEAWESDDEALPEVSEGVDDTQEMPAAGESAPAEMDEVGTKLDLARAYIDMGDPDGARSILEEVADEGDEAQREEARQLLESLD